MALVCGVFFVEIIMTFKNYPLSPKKNKEDGLLPKIVPYTFPLHLL